ncbi:glycosyltransferase family A protein [Aestuariibaculum lutulentum]|uniref:Glycosyltransferase family 2 protein n=1 Tax=Aestuariibaculum lutulentum TaxID=2920935 RepID=A0ABS9REI3_9FLAO|nr:glycosyltransferase family A protein [Aestuariibaculum lutulentum]MCH4551348.1 glycosyltransferase family 2 protein [Aestuariibaculum lutulentum]
MVNVENKEKDLEILISTMNRTSLGFLSNMFPDDYINYNILIVNQTSKANILKSNYSNIRVINSFEKGISKSRNLAIQNAKAVYCLLADDDIQYQQSFSKKILDAFVDYKEADIVTFQMINDKGELYNRYPDTVKHDRKTVSTVNSVVIAFRRKSVVEHNLFFNNYFGLGSIFETADEYVFLRSCLRANLNLFYKPIIILKHPCYSSGTDVSSDKVIFARSAVFYKYNGIVTYFKLAYHLLLLLKNNDLYFSQLFIKYKAGLKGILKYKSLLRQGLEIRNS